MSREMMRMKRQLNIKALLLVPALLAISLPVAAEIQGLTGTSFSLTAKTGHISTGDGNSILTWGFADDATGQMQYPGPTLIVNEDVEITVSLSNDLAEPVSIVFPGQSNVLAAAVTTDGDDQGLITLEAATGETVSYTFTPTEPGTYMYQSGSNVETQIEMGLVGALIVRPAMGDNFAYNNAGTEFDREFLYFLTEMDRSAHEGLDGGVPIDPASYDATLWFINGRNGPDTLYPDGDEAPWLPAQPYGSLSRAHPSDRVLMRIVGAGRDLHPWHHHGNNTWQIAQDGRLLASGPAATAPYPDFMERNGGDPNWLPDGATVPDQAISNYTITITPGSTYDAIFTWTGRDMNWDIYGDRPGHTATDCGAPLPGEDPNSHCLDLTVTLPEQQAMTFGGLWSGSPFLGTVDTLPPLEGGLNPNGGFSFMWHSHSEKELTNDDIFPGGMMTMFIVEAPEVALP
jgi:FtsP/CotA-like multicopper oxidase with cupredoxin domain